MQSIPFTSYKNTLQPYAGELSYKQRWYLLKTEINSSFVRQYLNLQKFLYGGK